MLRFLNRKIGFNVIVVENMSAINGGQYFDTVMICVRLLHGRMFRGKKYLEEKYVTPQEH
eukprot:snap_masked-scaffold_2-processed-gene-26.26-mRNA-1 protein AED:1.00 eAED:1.00 QI:0/0/0/0/1/1/2/0/59